MNPKDAIGSKKVGMSAVPAEVLMELGLAMQEGARKYGRHNYRIAGVRASVYYDAVMRHLMAWWEGEDVDPDSGITHLVKAMACLIVIRDGMFTNTWVDDRPPSLAKGWQSELNKKAADLVDRLPDNAPDYTKENKANKRLNDLILEADREIIGQLDAALVDDYSWVKVDMLTGPKARVDNSWWKEWQDKRYPDRKKS